jgi:tetratricopeptide (TPR) repeat protein
MAENFPPHLGALVRGIERDIYTRPESVIAPLRQLLQQCNSDEQIGYTCGQLGFAYLRLAEHRMSEIFYEYALIHQPDNVTLLANLAHAVYETGDKQKGVEYGRRAFKLKDQIAVAAGRIAMGTPNRGGSNLISFSLYGDDAKYCETAVLNCLAAKEHLPGFICRFYVDQSVPDAVVQRLRGQAAELVHVSGKAISFLPTFWRFLALDDRNADVVLVRDADSIVDAREAFCVNEWLETRKPFHIIRDDCCHTELIHAGLFGAKSGIVNNVEQRIAGFIASEENWPIGRYSDQLFLRKCVWPMVREHAVTHDSVYGYGTDVREIPPRAPSTSEDCNYFIGANYANYRLQFSVQGALAEGDLYFIRIIDEKRRVVCEHRMELANDGGLAISLPRSHAQKVDTGAWGYEILSENGQTRLRSIVARSAGDPFADLSRR